MMDLTIEEFNTLLCSTGYLPPRNESEHLFFEEMYADYHVKTEEQHVDVNAIINGSCKLEDTKDIRPHYEITEQEIGMAAEEFSMAARNFNKLPKDTIEKIKRQHEIKKEQDE